MEKNISPLLRKGTTLNLIEVAFIRTVAVELDEIMIDFQLGYQRRYKQM